MKKLVVGGCSFSNIPWLMANGEADWDNKNRCYGNQVAEQLGLEYVHRCMSSCSNYRVWRMVTRDILNGKITPEDIVIIQYTSYEREEQVASYERVDPSPEIFNVEGKHDIPKELYLFHSKIGQADTLPKHSLIRTALKLWEENYIHPSFLLERYQVYSALFEGFLISRGFNNVFFIKNGYNKDILNVGPVYSSRVYDALAVSLREGNGIREGFHYPGLHLTVKGHTELAEELATHIRRCI
jgi:hypothetical protein